MVTESGDFVKTKCIRICLEIWYCDPTNVKRHDYWFGHDMAFEFKYLQDNFNSDDGTQLFGFLLISVHFYIPLFVYVTLMSLLSPIGKIQICW